MRIRRIKNKGEGYYHLFSRCCEQLFLFLRCKVRYFTSSTFFGSKEFVNAEFDKHRYAFGAKRKTGARGIGICKNWDGVRLYSARDLKKSPVDVTA